LYAALLESSALTHYYETRVDLDVAGTSNSVLQTRTVQETVTHPWLEEDDGWGTEILQQKIVKDYIKSEKDSRLLWPGNIQGGYALVNEGIMEENHLNHD